ncbi:predicted protein [Naegleria gruberi]|uniref:Predicted protein n=1 Tax=Naegleria gruberi TaxID=5762 RepID=D2VY07_NAEGR|nr:uncharacterized protein NAEGRDRAFT_81655 [Naegleria gruberi]EFC38283.1 predicted protein [Naegleria gruberi]|eukprot:XP_002671027.1 predicted protein [Naegleria gruberi strain NEG-M]
MSTVVLLILVIIVGVLTHLSTQQISSLPLAQSIKQMIDHSHQHYPESDLSEYMKKLSETKQQRSALATSDIESGSWLLGDMTLFNDQCDQTILPFTQMVSTSNGITISHVIGSFKMTISTIIPRPLSNLYNAILSYDGDSIPICFNIKGGQLAFTSDFLLCSSVDNFTPTCQASNGNVYNIAIVYKSPGTISGGVTAGLIIGVVLFCLLILCCCICCIVCITRRNSRQPNYGRLN